MPAPQLALLRQLGGERRLSNGKSRINKWLIQELTEVASETGTQLGGRRDKASMRISPRLQNQPNRACTSTVVLDFRTVSAYESMEQVKSIHF